MTYKPVDSAIVIVVGPCIDDTDFKTLEEAIAYNAAGMDVSLIVEKTDGTTAVTAITLTTAGTSDWTHKDGGYYEIEVTAAQNAEEGIAYIRGVCTGVLPFESPRYNIVPANVYDSWVKGTDVLQVDTTQWLGTAVTANVAGQPTVDVTRLGAQTAPLIDLVDFASNGYDSTNNVVFSDLVYIHGSALTETAGQLAAGFTKLFDVATPLLVASDVMRGTDSAYTGTPPTAAAIVNEWETQSQADPTGFHVNVLEIGGTAQTANDNGADINDILADTDELQTDWVNGGRLDLILDACALEATVAALNNISTADVNTQVSDVIKTDTISEMAQGVPSATPTLEDAIMYLYMAWRNETTTTSTTHSVKNDGGTVITKATISDDATTFTKGEMASGP